MTRAQLRALIVGQAVKFKPPGSDESIACTIVQNGPTEGDLRPDPPSFLKLEDHNGKTYLWSLDFDINEIT
jgi:hypothetical protein